MTNLTVNTKKYGQITLNTKPHSDPLVTMTTVCLIGNRLICIDVYRNARLRTSTNLYIISLAISDIINAVIAMPFTVGVVTIGFRAF